MFEHMFESVKRLPQTPDNGYRGREDDQVAGVLAGFPGNNNNIVLRYLSSDRGGRP